MVDHLKEHHIVRSDQVDLRVLKSYLAELDRRGIESSSRERKTYAIKSLFEFLARHQVIRQDVSERLIPPTPKDKDPRFSTPLP